MADGPEYKIVADGKQAKNELGEVERFIERLGSRAKGRFGVRGRAWRNLAEEDQKVSFAARWRPAVLDYSAKLEQTGRFQYADGRAEAAAKHIDELASSRPRRRSSSSR